jgi:hypothetical protein
MIVGQFTNARVDVDLEAWRRSVDATAHRVGLVLCGDLEVATRVLARDRGPVGVGDGAADIRELLLYAISDDYFAVRQQLSTDISSE